MSNRGQIYKLEKSGNLIEVVSDASAEFDFGAEEVKQLKENTVDAAQEKHVPVISKTDDGYTIKVGDVDHPMQEDHWIEWIELVAGDEVYRKYLKAGQAPIATFKTDATNVYARAYCNLHGLWKSN